MILPSWFPEAHPRDPGSDSLLFHCTLKEFALLFYCVFSVLLSVVHPTQVSDNPNTRYFRNRDLKSQSITHLKGGFLLIFQHSQEKYLDFDFVDLLNH